MHQPIRTSVAATVMSVFLAAGGLSPSTAKGQSNPIPANQPPIKQAGPTQDPIAAKTISVDFKGGRMLEYIEALQAAAGDTPVNVIVPEDAKRVEVPAIKLREVTLSSAVHALEVALPPTNSMMVRVGENDSARNAAAVFSVRVERAGEGAGQRTGLRRRTQAFSIRDLIDPPASRSVKSPIKLEAADVLAAIETALQLNETAEPPRIMFHKETGLLLVSGTGDQNEVIDDILRRLRDDMQARWSSQRAEAQSAAERAGRIELFKNDVELAATQYETAEAKMNRIKLQVDKGVAPVDSLVEAEGTLRESRLKLDRARLILKHAEEDTGPTSVQKEDGQQVFVLPAPLGFKKSDSASVLRVLRSALTSPGAVVEYDAVKNAFAVKGSAEDKASAEAVLKMLGANGSTDKTVPAASAK